jgi:DNA-binding transcriptional regulator YdaS (Cro superfamily)
MTPKEALIKAIEAAGSQEKLASEIGYSQAAISQWLNINGQCPAEAALPIETAISRAVTRFQLRPDIYQASV